MSVKATVEGHEVSVSDICPVAVPQQDLKHVDRYRWNLKSYGSNVKARAAGAWLNEFFDSLSEDEWRQWQLKRDSNWPRTEAENAEIARINEDIRLVQEKDRGPFNNELKNEILELSNKRSRVVATGGEQSLESVKNRFHARLEMVREDMKRRAKTKDVASATAK